MEIDSTDALSSAIVALRTPSHVHHGSNRSPIFPVEIFEAILADERLTQPDIKALRETCRLFSFLVTPRLFERIGISRAWRDRKSFLNIAATPHLARAVRTVTWFELPGNHANLRLFHGGYPKSRRQFSDGPEPPRCRLKDWRQASYVHQELTWPDLSQEENAWRNRMFTEAASLFWWSLDTHFSGSWVHMFKRLESASDDIAADFFPVFCDSLRAMPGLSTFVWEPMHPDRPLQHSADGYPFVAQLFQSHDSRRVNDAEFSGFHHFLQKAIVSSRQWSGGPFINDLHLIDMTHFVNVMDMYAFHHLKRLHFCFLHQDLDRLDNLCNILNVLRNLIDLRLCFGIVRQETPPLSSEPTPFPVLSYATLTDTNNCFFPFLSRMPRLESLYLDEVPFSLNGLASFLEKHADTLRHLHVNLIPGYRLPPGYFSNISNLNLETFRLEHGGGCRFHRTEPWADSILDEGAQTYEDGVSTDIDELYDPEDEEMDEPESITEDEITAGQPVVPWEDDERPMYAREHMSQLRHLKRFRAAGGGEGPAVWKFKKRNGEEAWGEDPLEFWSDWEGSEAGDVREPVSPGWKAPASMPREKKPLTRSFFSKWDEPEWDGRIVRIDKYWEEALADEDIDIQAAGPNQPRYPPQEDFGL